MPLISTWYLRSFRLIAVFLRISETSLHHQKIHTSDHTQLTKPSNSWLEMRGIVDLDENLCSEFQRDICRFFLRRGNQRNLALMTNSLSFGGGRLSGLFFLIVWNFFSSKWQFEGEKCSSLQDNSFILWYRTVVGPIWVFVPSCPFCWSEPVSNADKDKKNWKKKAYSKESKNAENKVMVSEQ